MLGALVLVCSAALTQAPARSVIAGTVVDSISRLPIADVTVTLRSVGRFEAEITSDGKVTLTPNPVFTTDANGQFTFENLRASAYTLMATTRRGFVQGAAYLEIAADQQVRDVEIRLARFGSVAGTVRDANGDPVVGMRVDVFQRRTLAFRPSLFPRGGAVTDDRGAFRAADLPPGDYVVCACGRDPLPIDKALLPLLGATNPAAAASAVTRRLDDAIPAFPMTFYPGVTRTSEALTVSIASAEDRTGLDIAVRAITPRRVSGQLSGVGAVDATAFTLVLVPEHDGPAANAITEIDAVHVTPGGAFEFVAVPPGHYSLLAYPKDPQQTFWGSATVTVEERDVTGLAIPMTAGATVTGRVEFAGRAARPDAAALQNARVSLVPADLSPQTLVSVGSRGSVGQGSTVQADGTFRVTGVPPGRHTVMASGFGPAWQLIESVRSGPSSTLGRVVSVDRSGMDSVIITMTDANRSLLYGTVVLEKYESPQPLRVLVFPADPAAWSDTMQNPDRFMLASIGFDMRFRFGSLPAGDYFAVVVAADGQMGPEQFELWSRTATRITLREGQTTTVELRR